MNSINRSSRFRVKVHVMTRKLLFVGSLVLLLVTGIDQVFAQQTSIKLFDATPTFGSGPQTSPDEAIPFASTTLILNFAPGDTAVISSTPDGTGPIVIDNFMTINGVNVCVGVEGQLGPESCFGHFIQDPGDPGVIGMPIETVLTPIPPIDVSRLIPVETGAVVFELRDLGAIAGNTDLFLVSTLDVGDFGPEDLLEPDRLFVEQAASALTAEDTPYFDQAGRQCPAPVPPEQRGALNCRQFAQCDSRGRNCVPTHVVCITCGTPPPPMPPPLPPDADETEADEPQTRCPGSFFADPSILVLGEPPRRGGDRSMVFQQAPEPELCRPASRRLLWQLSHGCRKPKINPEQGCVPLVNTQLVRGQPGMRSYGQPASRWGLQETIAELNRIAAEWNSRHDNMPPIRVGDLSFQNGGDHPGHKSHHDGLNVDILAVGKDNTGDRVDFLKEPDKYSRERTRELIQIIRRTGRVDFIYFDDKQLQAEVFQGEVLCHPASKRNPNANDHTDHLHVRFKKP